MSARFQIGLRRLRWLSDLAAVGVVLLATLRPVGVERAAGFVWCFWCGTHALAEALQNVVLFVPLGAVLLWRRVPRLPALAAGAALAFTVETLQLWIPGRSPSVGDVVFNTLGTGLGWWVAAALQRGLALPPERTARWSIGAALAAAAVLAATGALLRPATLPPPATTSWRLRLPSSPSAGARIVAVQLGPQALRPGPLPPDAPPRWAAGEPLTLTLVPNAQRAAFAPAVTIEDARGRPWLSVGLGWDVVVWTRTRATALGLDEPDLRWPGLLRGVGSRDTVTLSLVSHGARTCLALGRERHCTAPALGSGWTLLLYPDQLPGWLRDGLSAAWLGALFFPLALWARRRAVTAVAAAIGAGAAIGVPLWHNLLPLQPAELAGIIAALAAGHLTARAAARRRSASPRSATRPPRPPASGAVSSTAPRRLP